MEISDIDARLKEADIKELKYHKSRLEFKNMTFADRLQLPNRKWDLKRVEQNQKHTFQVMINRHAKHLNGEWEDMFADFFTVFLKNECDSIADYLYVNKRVPMLKRELKPEWVKK